MPVRVGLMDLDTGHGLPFSKRLNAMPGVRVTAAFDHGDVRSDEQVRDFCRRIGCVHARDIQTLIDHCDVVMAMGVDWSARLDRVEPIMRQGRAVFLCKPPVGSVAHVRELLAIQAETGAPVLTGSGWRWAPPTRQLAERIDTSTLRRFEVFAPAPRFYYGIHAWELLAGVLGPGVVWVEPVAIDTGDTSDAGDTGDVANALDTSDAGNAGDTSDAGDTGGVSRFRCGHVSGVEGRITLGGGPRRGFDWVDDHGQHAFDLTPPQIHAGFCDTVVEMTRAGRPPLALEEQLSTVLVALAVELSVQRSDRVYIRDLPDDFTLPFDGFVDTYRPNPLI